MNQKQRSVASAVLKIAGLGRFFGLFTVCAFCLWGCVDGAVASEPRAATENAVGGSSSRTQQPTTAGSAGAPPKVGAAAGAAGAAGPPDGAAAGDEWPENGCGPLPAYEPAAANDFQIGVLDYAATNLTVGVRPQLSLGVRGRIYYPASEAGNGVTIAADGPFPIVVMLHGNHARYRKADGSVVSCSESFAGGRHLSLEEIQVDYPGATEIPSYLGYAYLGERLAAAGYVFVSIDGNDANCVNVGGGGFNAERADLIREHLRVLKDSKGHEELRPLVGGLDYARTVVAGHSRGGEAAIEVGAGSAVSGITLKGVIAVAPTDFLFSPEQTRMQSSLLVVLPAADGDVIYNSGMRYYDVIESSGASGWFKAQQYLFGANHNFFNSEWSETFASCGVTSNDGDNGAGNGDDRLSRDEQERYLVSITRAYLAAVFERDTHARITLAGNAKLEGLEELAVAASYREGWAALPMSSTPEFSGFQEFEKHFFLQGEGTYNATFFHATSGYVGVWSKLAANFSVPVEKQVAALDFVSLRVAQVVDPLNTQGRESAIDVELEDAAGKKVRAPSDWANLKIPSWYERPPYRVSTGNCKGLPVTKTVLSTVQIPRSCFKGDSGFSYAALATLRVHMKDAKGVLAFSDFQLGGKSAQ